MTSDIAQKSVIFDVGRVLMDWDLHSLYDQVFPSRGDTEAFFIETGLLQWNERFDAGLSFAEGLGDLCDQFPHYEVELRAFDERWIETIPDAIHGTVSLLEKLKKADISLFAITNFSAEKWPVACAHYPFLSNSFRDIVVSGEVKVTKPQADIFHILLRRNNLKANECVFIDDSARNVDAAKRLGIAGIEFVSPEQLQLELMEYGLLEGEGKA